MIYAVVVKKRSDSDSPAGLGFYPTHQANLWVDQFPFAARAANLVLLFSLFVSWEQKKIILYNTSKHALTTSHSCCWATQTNLFSTGSRAFCRASSTALITSENTLFISIHSASRPSWNMDEITCVQEFIQTEVQISTSHSNLPGSFLQRSWFQPSFAPWSELSAVNQPSSCLESPSSFCE